MPNSLGSMAAEFTIPKIAFETLGEYDRAKGFAPSSATLDRETLKLAHDRGREFEVDPLDDKESQSSEREARGEGSPHTGLSPRVQGTHGLKDISCCCFKTSSQVIPFKMLFIVAAPELRGRTKRVARIKRQRRSEVKNVPF